jgi:hypothetical protein
MNCPYCNAELDESADRCTTCLKHLPHRDQTYTPVQAPSTPTLNAPTASVATPNIGQSVAIPEPGVYGTMIGTPQAGIEVTTTSGFAPSDILLEQIKTSRPNEPVNPADKLKVLQISVLTGVVVGIIYFAVSKIFDLIFLFPLIAGALVGGVIGSQIKSRKVRNASFALACGVMAGVLAYGIKVTGEAYTVRASIVDEATPEIALARGISEADARAYLEKRLNPVETFKLYFEDYGVKLTHGGSSSGAAITGRVFWLLLAAQCALVAWIAGATARDNASFPFCEACRTWRKTDFVTGKHPKQAKQLIDLVRRQDWESAKNLPLAAKINDKAICRVQAVYCPTCQSGLVQVSSTSGNTTKKLFASEISDTSMAALRGVNQVPVADVVSTLPTAS